MTMGLVIWATQNNANEVNYLRCKEYAASKQFTLTDKTSLLWSETDDESVVLIAKNDENDAVATMRGEFHKSYDALETALQNTLPVIPEIYPALILSRGATSQNHQYQGLNSLLRLYFFQIAIKQGTSHVYGCVYSGAPRIKIMEQLGYEFYNSEKEQKGRNAHTDLLIAVLDLTKKGDIAINALLEKTKETRRQFPLTTEVLMR